MSKSQNRDSFVRTVAGDMLAMYTATRAGFVVASVSGQGSPFAEKFRMTTQEARMLAAELVRLADISAGVIVPDGVTLQVVAA